METGRSTADPHGPEAPPPPRCPPATVLAAWVEQGLVGADRDDVASHLTQCGECRRLMIEVAELGRRHLLWAQQPATPVDHRVQAAIELMRRNMGQHISVPQLASHAGVSPSELRLLFGRDIGLPPLLCLRHLRLEHAGVLLCSGHQSVKEIMFAVGWRDASHFVRDFERHFGLSPARYRQQYFGSTSQRTRHGQ